VSDYLDVLLAPGAELDALRLVWEYLRAHADEFDACELEQLSGDGPLVRVLSTRDLWDQWRPHEPCPVLMLPTGAKLEDCIPNSQHKRLAYDRRRLARAGEASFEQATQESVDALLSVLIASHAARWNERQQPGVLHSAPIRRFHREASRRLVARGALRLYGLRWGGHVIAAHYGFLSHRRGYYYLGGFDPRWRHVSPGVLLVGHAIESALAEGAVAFDFLRGREAYKYAWGAQDRVTYRCRFVPDRSLCYHADRRHEALESLP
jgi:hypothetical protein